MSEKIYQALTDDFIRRMRNWARAEAGLGVGGIGASSIYSLGVRVDRYVNTALPVLEGEALDTGAALAQVPIRYRQAVEQFWRFEGRPIRWHARRLRPPGSGMSYHTFEVWVLTGHEHLRAALGKRSEAHRDRFFEIPASRLA